jgi:hypothetical protein
MEIMLRLKRLHRGTPAPMAYMVIMAVLLIHLSAFARYNLLIVRTPGGNYTEIIRGLSAELSEEFAISELVIENESDLVPLTNALAQMRPDILVLIDNQALALVKAYQKTQADITPAIPSVALMGVHIDQLLTGMKNATGILYEVPIVTPVVNLRSILHIPIRTVGVVHREFMNNILVRNRPYCDKEKITLLSYPLPNKKFSFHWALRKGLRQLLAKQKVDALWVLNDNELLTADLVRDVWIPSVQEFKVPIIVGVEVLVAPDLNFGTFAVIPDLVSLGIQAAGLVDKIKENNWQVEKGAMYPPLAVYQFINFRQARDRYHIQESELQNIHCIVK